jgi:hypothetical protein
MSLADAYDIEEDTSYDSHQKRKKAADMMVPIMKIQLPDELLRTISQFLFYDISSNVYHEKRQTQYYKSIMQCVVKEFKQCRYNEYKLYRLPNFHNIEFRIGCHLLNIDTILHFHLVMCTRCGCYKHDCVNYFEFNEIIYPLPLRAMCICH